MLLGMVAVVAGTTLIECLTSGVILGGTVYAVAKTKKSPSKLK